MIFHVVYDKVHELYSYQTCEYLKIPSEMSNSSTHLVNKL